DDARLAAMDELQRGGRFEHDEELWISFTERIVRGMGGDAGSARACAVEMVRAWERHENFTLYDDAPPVLEDLRRRGMRMGLVSNGQRDLEEFVEHHHLDVDVAVGSASFGRTKPHPSIFLAALERLGVEPPAAAMVGDSPKDDIEGARQVGMRAILID